MIEFRRFSFTYWGRSQPALRNVDLRIDEGERVLVAGPSGSGKSTLARCMNGLIPHFHGGSLSGRVIVDGLETTDTQPRDLATRVGMVFQDPENQLVATDLERDVAFGPENLGLSPLEIASRVNEALDALGIASLRGRTLMSLSGGEKQKAVIAGVLALRPRTLVLDEPSSELDPASADEFLGILSVLQRRQRLTTVLIEHRVERVIGFVDRVVLVDRGEIVADGRPSDVLDSSQARHLGIGLPPVLKLASELRARGMWNGVLPVTLGEASVRLSRMTEHAHERPRVSHISCSDSIVAFDDLTFRYEEQQTAALSNVSVSLDHESVFAVMGRNGSGKTTLVKHFNGLLRPGSGVVKVDGRNVADFSVAEMARRVGLVFQNPNDHLFADTVEEELAFTLTHQGLAPPRIEARIDETCALFGLASLRREHPRSLSGGERQRVALASVFAARPRVLVLDEPTRGMGAALKRELSAVLHDYSQKGNLVVVVTHDVETAVEQVDRVLLLENGKVDMCGDTRTALDGHPVFASQMNRLAKVLQITGGPVSTVSDMLEVLT